MKRVLIAALVALFAASFTMAQDQVVKKEKKAQTTMTKKKGACCSEAKAAADMKECAGMKDCADMKDCPAVKETKMSDQGTTGAKEVKTAETKPADVK